MAGTVVVAALVALLAPQEQISAEKERSRFLMMAVLEGLWEDGAKPDLIQAIVKDPWSVFVPKCPICMPVRHAFRILAAAPPPDMYDSRGPGLPAALEAQLRDVDVPTRKKGLMALVDRYVERRFERVKMSDEEKGRLRRLIAEGRKIGTGYMNPAPGDFCPSCEGAVKAAK
jgi:hypothetical protein